MLARVPDCTRRAAGACRRLVSGSRDSWAPERLGVRTFNPIETHRSGLAHRPGSVNDQKHTFAIDYFRSAACRALLKVTWDGAVTVNVDEGRFVAFAKRPIRAGEIVEKGILRGIELGALDDAAHNPYVCKLGQDFLLSTGFPWHRSEVPGPPFLPSGALMFYPKSTSKYNVTVLVKESPVEGFEFDAVAAEDIPEGAPLVRKVGRECAPAPRHGDNYHMSDEQLESYIEMIRQLDKEKAASAGVQPEVLHEDAIREHILQTRSGNTPVISCEKTVTIPHPMWPGFGVFAVEDIKAGEVVESGLHGKIEGLQGDRCPYVFTWNSNGKRHTDGTENVWAQGGGNAMFYNSDSPANCRMYRFFDQYRYLIVAKTDIKEGEEVMHLYASSSWRKCFVQDASLPKLLPVEQSSLGAPL